MARYKLNNDGSAYYDEQDSGPDQASPEQIQQLKGQQQQPQQDSSPYPTYDGPTGADGPKKPEGWADNAAYIPGGGSGFHNLEDQMLGMNDAALSGGQSFDPAQSSPNTGVNGGATPVSSNGALPSPYSAQGAANQVAQTAAPSSQNPAQMAANQVANTVVATGPQSAAPPAAPSPAPAGFDQGKWADPNKHDPKYDVGHMVASGATGQQIVDMMNQKYSQQYGGQYKLLSNDKMLSPDGNVIDFIHDEEGAHLPAFDIQGPAGSGGAAGPALAGRPGGASGAPGPAGGFGAGYGGGPMGDAIARLLGRGENGTNASDPNIAGPTAAFRAQSDAAVRQSRQALAERAAAEGANYGGAGSGYFDSGIQSQIEQGGRDVANHQGQLITQEIAAKRTDVVNALQFAQGQEKLALEQYLAQLNDQLQRAQMGQQNSQFYDNYGLRMAEDASGLDRQLLSSLT